MIIYFLFLINKKKNSIRDIFIMIWIYLYKHYCTSRIDESILKLFSLLKARVHRHRVYFMTHAQRGFTGRSITELTAFQSTQTTLSIRQFGSRETIRFDNFSTILHYFFFSKSR